MFRFYLVLGDAYDTDSNDTSDADPNRKELSMDEALETAGNTEGFNTKICWLKFLNSEENWFLFSLCDAKPNILNL